MGLTADIAAFATALDAGSFSARVVETVQASILDGIGCMMLGSADPPVEALIVGGVARVAGSGCAVIGRDLRAHPLDAALLNGTACHAQDYDDVCYATIAHPTAAILPAALAACEESGRANAPSSRS